MTTVRVRSGFCLGGGVDVLPGQLLELPDHIARIKIAQGFVVEVRPEELAAATAARPNLDEHHDNTAFDTMVRDPQPEDRDPRSRRRRRR